MGTQKTSTKIRSNVCKNTPKMTPFWVEGVPRTKRHSHPPPTYFSVSTPGGILSLNIALDRVMSPKKTPEA